MADQPEVDVSALRAALARATSDADTLRGQVAERDRKITSETAGRITAEEAAVDNAITAKENERDTLKARFAQLNAEGDFVAAADVQYQMAEVAADLRDYGKQKTHLAGAREAAGKTPPVQPAAQQPQIPAARKKWFDAHPEFFEDKKFEARALALHAQAVADDMVPDSKEYFEFIDDGLAQAQPARQSRAAAAADDQGEKEITVDNPRSQPAEAVIPAGATPEKPQSRAAGAGSFAAAPSRRASTPAAQQRTTSLTSDQADSALRLASSLRPDLHSQADIYTWYAGLMDTPSVRSRMSGAA